MSESNTTIDPTGNFNRAASELDGSALAKAYEALGVTEGTAKNLAKRQKAMELQRNKTMSAKACMDEGTKILAEIFGPDISFKPQEIARFLYLSFYFALSDPVTVLPVRAKAFLRAAQKEVPTCSFQTPGIQALILHSSVPFCADRNGKPKGWAELKSYFGVLEQAFQDNNLIPPTLDEALLLSDMDACLLATPDKIAERIKTLATWADDPKVRLSRQEAKKDYSASAIFAARPERRALQNAYIKWCATNTKPVTTHQLRRTAELERGVLAALGHAIPQRGIKTVPSRFDMWMLQHDREGVPPNTPQYAEWQTKYEALKELAVLGAFKHTGVKIAQPANRTDTAAIAAKLRALKKK